MLHVSRSFGLLATTLLLLLAGCPTESTTATTGVPSVAAGTGDGTGTSGRPFVEPTAAGASSVSVSGVTATADALTGKYSGCELPGEGDSWRAEILRLVNEKRVAAGLGTVTSNPTLEAQATQYACEMIHDDFFGHVSPSTGSSLGSRAKEFGYEFWIIGENLAAGQHSPAEAITAWMNSPCHRQNILNPAFTELGVGVRVGGDYGIYWVQEFGRPASLKPYPGPPYHDPQCTE